MTGSIRATADREELTPSVWVGGAFPLRSNLTAGQSTKTQSFNLVLFNNRLGFEAMPMADNEPFLVGMLLAALGAMASEGEALSGQWRGPSRPPVT
jgi:hypothetical protein